MKNGKIIVVCLLSLAAIMLAWFCVDSVVTPIQFDNTRTEREPAVIKNLIAIRTAEVEYHHVNGRYMQDADSLLLFLKTQPKKEVAKEGSLTEAQLEKGLTEAKAVKLINTAKAKAKSQKNLTFESDSALYAYIWANDREIQANGLVGFRRDTVYNNMIQSLYKGEYDENTIDAIMIIPFSKGVRYTIAVDNEYKNSKGYHSPLFEATAHFETYLGDQDKQELINLVDKETKLDHYPGLRVGNVLEPNNNAGNWE